MADDTKTTALALRSPSVSMAAYEPRDYDQAMKMAATIGRAAGLTAEVAYLKMAAGAEYGIPAITALRLFDVIDGQGGTKQPAPRAQLMVALCLRATEVCEYIEQAEGDDKACTWRAKRRGRPEQTETYTIEQARKAGLIRSGGNWEKDPASMLSARASSRLARRVFPDVVGGMVSREEGEVLEATPEPVQPLPKSGGGSGGAAVLEPRVVLDADWTEQQQEPPHNPATGEVQEMPQQRAIMLLGTARTDDDLTAARKACQAVWPQMKDAPADIQTLWKEAKARVEAIKAEGAR